MLGIIHIDLDAVDQLEALLGGLNLLGCELGFGRYEAHLPPVDFAWIGIGGDLGLGAYLHATQVALIDVAAKPGMIDVAYRYHGGPGRKNLADIRRFDKDYAIDGRGYDRVGQLSVDEGYLSALALDIGAARYYVLLLPGHVQLLRLGPLDAGGGAGHLGAGGFDLFLARTLFDQRQTLLGLAQRGCGGFSVLAVLIELPGGDVVLLEEDRAACQ